MSSIGSTRGAAAAQLGFDYQLDVSILAALQLLLISKAASQLVLEPANEEDLEADLKPEVPGRLQSSAMIAGAYKLVVQVKRNTGEPWSIDSFIKLLTHGSDKTGGRRKALHHLDDPNTRYLLVTTAAVKGVARELLVNSFEEAADKDKFPGRLRDTLKTSPEGRVAIWGGLTERQLRSDLRELISDLLHVPHSRQEDLLEKLRSEAKRRTRGAAPGVWTREDILATVTDHGGFLSSLADLEHFTAPKNFDEMLAKLRDKGAIVIRGPSGTGKTQAALKLCDLARQHDGRLEVVSLGADDSPTSARKLVDHGPTLFYIEDPWGQYSLREGAESWTEQLPRLLAKATPNHQFVITSRSDMMRKAEGALSSWSVELSAEQYRNGQLRKMFNDRMERLPPALQSKAFAFRESVLVELETPFEIDLYFKCLAQGPEPEEMDYAFARRLLDLAHRNAVEDVVVSTLDASDSSGAAAIIWALLASRGQFDRGQLSPLQRVLRSLDRDLGEALEKLLDRMVAARHLRQPLRTIAFAHPSVRQGFEAFLTGNWLRCEAAIETLIQALTRLPDGHRAWGIETAARVVEVTRSLALGVEGDNPFEVDDTSQAAIDQWLDEGLIDSSSKFMPLLSLASEVGSPASILSQVAFWLLKGTQRGSSFFIQDWKPPVFDDAWYEAVAADPRSGMVAARFIREELGFDQGAYGAQFVTRLDRIAPNLTPAYIDAALNVVGNGFEMNVDAIAAGAIRDLSGYQAVVSAALDDLAEIQRRYDKSYVEEWRAIDDGERDACAEEAMHSCHADDGYTSSTLVTAYIQRLRTLGTWEVIASHPRVAELVRFWARDLYRSNSSPSQAEIEAIVNHSKGLSDEFEVWSALAQHWCPAFEPRLEARFVDCAMALDLRDTLAGVALVHAPNLLVNRINCLSVTPDCQLMLLADISRASYRVDMDDRELTLKRVADHLQPELAEIIMAFPGPRGSPGKVASAALKILTDNVLELAIETLSLVVPVIVASGGNASCYLERWLSHAKGKEDALSACQMAIKLNDQALVKQALCHPRADARQAALMHLAPSMPDPLPASILAMAKDPGSGVRQALVSVLSRRPHPDHLHVLVGLLEDQWSSADYHTSESETYKIAQDAVKALVNYVPLADAVGDRLLELADRTNDRFLSQLALIVAANACSAGIQQKISNVVSQSGGRRIRLDALEALADAQELDPSITAHLDASFLTGLPPILAAHGAHLIGAHASETVALAIFTSIASLNRRRVLLLVGATAMAARDRKVADQILDLLEPGHPARQILNASEPLPYSVLDDLGSVAMRESVRDRLGGRIADG